MDDRDPELPPEAEPPDPSDAARVTTARRALGDEGQGDASEDLFLVFPSSLFEPVEAEDTSDLPEEEPLFFPGPASDEDGTHTDVSDLLLQPSMFLGDERNEGSEGLGASDPELRLSADIFESARADEPDDPIVAPPLDTGAEPALAADSDGSPPAAGDAPADPSEPVAADEPQPDVDLPAELFAGEGSDGADTDGFVEPMVLDPSGMAMVPSDAPDTDPEETDVPVAFGAGTETAQRAWGRDRLAAGLGGPGGWRTPTGRRRMRAAAGGLAACALLGVLVAVQPDPKAPRLLETARPRPTTPSTAGTAPTPTLNPLLGLVDPPAVPGAEAPDSGAAPGPAPPGGVTFGPAAAGAPRAAAGPAPSTAGAAAPRAPVVPSASSGGGAAAPAARPAPAPAPSNDPAPPSEPEPEPETRESSDRRANREAPTTTEPPETTTTARPSPTTTEPVWVAPTPPPATTAPPPPPTTAAPPPSQTTTVPPTESTSPRPARPCIEGDPPRLVPC